MLQPQDFLYELSGHTWAKEYGSNHDVELNLDGAHAGLAPVQGVFNAAVAFRANGLMHSELRFCRVHQSFLGQFCAAKTAINAGTSDAAVMAAMSLVHSVTTAAR